MCAIAGFVGLFGCDEIVERMLKTMLHRGPDGNGSFTDEDCTLLHSRLAVIDPDGGGQPMHLKWHDEEFTIVYNGELYNTQEVRSTLLSLGHQFLGHSDTEVVLHAFACWGEASLERLNGIFAFGVWLHKQKKLFLARDRMGVKPLFYKLHQGGLIFASEIKTILSYPTVSAKLDADGVAQLLLLGPGRTPGSGVIKDIREIEPGCFAWYENRTMRIKQYWMLQDKPHTDSFEETAQYVRYLVIDAIRRQMVSDVPIGTFLSGGLDSSIITAVGAEYMRQQGKKLKTFSLDYQNNAQYFMPGKFQPDSDNAFIEIMNAHLQIEHYWSVLNVEELLTALPLATAARDLPGMADVDSSLLLFCKDIRHHVKVALSGECADEIFGGYPWFRDPQIRDREGFPWAQNLHERTGFLSREYRDRIDAKEFVLSRYFDTIKKCHVLPDTCETERKMKQMVYLNQRWFMQTLLDRKDRMSMHCALEVRVPFCDYRIVEYLYSVPWSFKEYQGREKGLLRYAMKDLLPEQILHRKKSPYPKTYDPRYTQLVQSALRVVLQEKDAPILQIVNKAALENLMQTEYTWPWYGQLMKTPQTIAFMLQINTWMQNYHIEPI